MTHPLQSIHKPIHPLQSTHSSYQSTRKQKNTRNPNACEFHRRGHQKCPVECPGRLGKGKAKAKDSRRLRLYLHPEWYTPEESTFLVFCTAIRNVLSKYGRVYQHYNLKINYEDCLQEFYLHCEAPTAIKNFVLDP